LTVAEFNRFFNEFKAQYGFFCSKTEAYSTPANRPAGVLGERFIEVLDPMMAIILAQDIRRAIRRNGKSDAILPARATETSMRAQASAPLGGGPVPESTSQGVISKISDGQVQVLKAALAERHNRKLRASYNVFSVLYDEEAQSADLLLHKNKGGTVCQAVCHTSEPLPRPLYIFATPNSVKEQGLCQDCTRLTLEDSVGKFFDSKTQTIDPAKLAAIANRLGYIATVDDTRNEATNEIWPSVPLGQLMWVLCSDRRAVGPLAKAWMTGVVDICTRISRDLLTCCPNHPNVLYRMPAQPTELKCPHCNYRLCPICRRWHTNAQPCEKHPADVKFCPFCWLPSKKTSGCNHIACPQCKKHWCWKCGLGSETSEAVYNHMKKEHGGWHT
jgi:hypothetical protein